MLFSPVRLCRAWLCCALLCAVPAWAGEKAASNADVKYDRTGDGLVDAEDWALMSDKEKLGYARDSLLELGLAPDAAAGDGRTRLQDYLDGLRSVYGK